MIHISRRSFEGMPYLSYILYLPPSPCLCPSLVVPLRPKWVRIPAKNVYYYRCPDHRRNYVMSFSFCFDREDDVYQFAYCFPYTYTRLQTYLDSIGKLKQFP